MLKQQLSFNQTPKAQKLSPVGADKRLSLNQQSKILMNPQKKVIVGPSNNANSQLRLQISSPVTFKPAFYSPKANMNFMQRGPERLSDRSIFNNSGIVYHKQSRKL
jgi:hypothetical protein